MNVHTPLMVSLSHIWKSPMLQARQDLTKSVEFEVSVTATYPSWPPCQGPPTRSPTFHFFSPSPTATTSPTPSCPGTLGKVLPNIACCTALSEWHTPQARTFTRIWEHHRQQRHQSQGLKANYLSWLWHLERNILEGERGAFGFEDGDLVFFGKVVSHCVVVSR